MGIIKPGVLGETTGKVSNLIFYNVNGQLRVRKCPAKVRNPRSPKQTAQRTRVKRIVYPAMGEYGDDGGGENGHHVGHDGRRRKDKLLRPAVDCRAYYPRHAGAGGNHGGGRDDGGAQHGALRMASAGRAGTRTSIRLFQRAIYQRRVGELLSRRTNKAGRVKDFAKLQERGSVKMTLPRVLCGEGGISRRGVR